MCHYARLVRAVLHTPALRHGMHKALTSRGRRRGGAAARAAAADIAKSVDGADSGGEAHVELTLQVAE